MQAKRKIRTFPAVQVRARELRKSMTVAETKLWDRLRDRRLNGLKFRRQHPLGPFIADFYCAQYHLVVELDGEIHRSQVDEDRLRTQQFEDYGYRLIRFSNQAVEQDIEAILIQISAACNPNHNNIHIDTPKKGQPTE